jgi:hypothetical protein
MTTNHIEQRVVCAAIKLGDVIVTGPRHYDTIMCNTIKQMDMLSHWTDNAEQGFVDQRGNFLTREEAWIIAEKVGQIIRRVGGDGVRLYSENLY